MAGYEYDYLFKIVIIGDSGCGKSSLLMRFADNLFEEHFVSTIGVDFKIRTIKVGSKTVKFHIWDTSGNRIFAPVTSSYYRNAQGVIVVYDMTDAQSFSHVNYWLDQIDQYTHTDARPTLMLVGTKSDLEEKKMREVDQKDAEKLACDLGISHIECSAKTGYNVDKVFALLSEALEQKISKQLDPKVKKSPDIRTVDLGGKKGWELSACCA